MSEPVYKTPVLLNNGVEFHGLNWYFCGYSLAQHFNLPVDECEDPTVCSIQLLAYSRPGKNRVEVTRDAHGRVNINGEYVFFADCTHHLICDKLKKHGPTLYVECEYSE